MGIKQKALAGLGGLILTLAAQSAIAKSSITIDYESKLKEVRKKIIFLTENIARKIMKNCYSSNDGLEDFPDGGGELAQCEAEAQLNGTTYHFTNTENALLETDKVNPDGSISRLYRDYLMDGIGRLKDSFSGKDGKAFGPKKLLEINQGYATLLDKLNQNRDNFQSPNLIQRNPAYQRK